VDVFEIVIGLLLCGAALAAIARRIGTPYPALVAFAGAALALVPGAPTLVLDPQLALALFVAPVLLDAAFDASPRDLRANWRSVASLAIGAVALTVVVVALVARRCRGRPRSRSAPSSLHRMPPLRPPCCANFGRPTGCS